MICLISTKFVYATGQLIIVLAQVPKSGAVLYSLENADTLVLEDAQLKPLLEIMEVKLKESPTKAVIKYHKMMPATRDGAPGWFDCTLRHHLLWKCGDFKSEGDKVKDTDAGGMLENPLGYNLKNGIKLMHAYICAYTVCAYTVRLPAGRNMLLHPTPE